METSTVVNLDEVSVFHISTGTKTLGIAQSFFHHCNFLFYKSLFAFTSCIYNFFLLVVYKCQFSLSLYDESPVIQQQNKFERGNELWQQHSRLSMKH